MGNHRAHSIALAGSCIEPEGELERSQKVVDTFKLHGANVGLIGVTFVSCRNAPNLQTADNLEFVRISKRPNRPNGRPRRVEMQHAT